MFLLESNIPPEMMETMKKFGTYCILIGVLSTLIDRLFRKRKRK